MLASSLLDGVLILWSLGMGYEAILHQPTLQHATIGCVCDGVNMWRYFVPLLAAVHVHNFLSVNW